MYAKKEYSFPEKIYSEVIEKVRNTDTMGHYIIKEYGNRAIIEKEENNEIIKMRWTEGKKNLIVTVYVKDEMGKRINEILENRITSTKNIISSNADYTVYRFP